VILVLSDEERRKRKNKQGKIYRDTHKEQVKESKAKEYQKHKERYKKYNAQYNQRPEVKAKKQSPEFKAKTKSYNDRPEQKVRAIEQRDQRKISKTAGLKQKIASVNNRPVECFGYPSYGSCSPDGTPETRTERLEFDHIHGGGQNDRLGSTGYKLGKLQWLVIQLKLSDKKLKEKLQLLCSGCNQEKTRAEQRKKS